MKTDEASKARIAAIDAEIATLVRRMEILSEEGAIDEASALNARVEEFKRERKAVIDVQKALRNPFMDSSVLS